MLGACPDAIRFGHSVSSPLPLPWDAIAGFEIVRQRLVEQIVDAARTFKDLPLTYPDAQPRRWSTRR